jgi:hypothetical protein
LDRIPPTAVFPKHAYSSDQNRSTVAPGAWKSAVATRQNLCAEVLVAGDSKPEKQSQEQVPSN